jgi:hypothetical protein
MCDSMYSEAHLDDNFLILLRTLRTMSQNKIALSKDQQSQVTRLMRELESVPFSVWNEELDTLEDKQVAAACRVLLATLNNHRQKTSVSHAHVINRRDVCVVL